MNDTSPTPPRRLTELDWLRIIAFGLLILYHVGMYYVRWPWHVKTPHPVPALETWMQWLNPWRLPLLFLISGAALSLLVGPAGGRRIAAARTRRLLPPILFGMAVVVPPQAWMQVGEQFGYGGGYLDFLRLYFQAYHGFCRDGRCLDLPTWNHLWFVVYLWHDDTETTPRVSFKVTPNESGVATFSINTGLKSRKFIDHLNHQASARLLPASPPCLSFASIRKRSRRKRRLPISAMPR